MFYLYDVHVHVRITKYKKDYLGKKTNQNPVTCTKVRGCVGNKVIKMMNCSFIKFTCVFEAF